MMLNKIYLIFSQYNKWQTHSKFIERTAIDSTHVSITKRPSSEERNELVHFFSDNVKYSCSLAYTGNMRIRMNKYYAFI